MARVPAADDPHEMVSVLIKNVYHPFETQRLSLAQATTVHGMKELLTEALPTHPDPRQQKLICSGRICKDEQTLQEITRGLGHQLDAEAADEVVPVVFHLMLPKSASAGPVGAQAAAEPKTEPKTEIKVEEEKHTEQVVQQENAAISAPVSAPASAPVSAPGEDNKPANSAQQANYQMYMQLLLLQQQTMIVAQIQYLQHLQAQLQAQNVQGNAAPAQHYQDPYQMPANLGHFSRFANTPQPVAVPPPVAANLPNIPAAAGVAAQANVGPAPVGLNAAAPAAVPAAAVAAQAPRFGRLREFWAMLDLRMAVKMAFMLFILGQDLPTDRLILLTTMVLIIYLYFTGILRKLVELIRPRARRHGAADAPDPVQPDFTTPTIESFARILRVSNERGFWKDIGSFLGGLLLSLVPAWHPQPIQDPADAAAAPADEGVPDVDMANLQGL